MTKRKVPVTLEVHADSDEQAIEAVQSFLTGHADKGGVHDWTFNPPVSMLHSER